MTRPVAEIARFVDDVPAGVRFYSALLGRGPDHQSPEMAIFTTGDIKVLIHARYTPGPGDLPCEDHIALSAPDLDAAIADLAAQGISVEHPPRDYPWGRSAYLRDPCGRLIELQQNPASTASPPV